MEDIDIMNELAGKIQDSELEVMRVLWESKDAMPLAEVRRILSARCGWEDSTIKTLLRRLQAKGIVKLERRGVYSAIVTEEEYSQWSTRTFLNKIFAGSAKKPGSVAGYRMGSWTKRTLQSFPRCSTRVKSMNDVFNNDSISFRVRLFIGSYSICRKASIKK